MHRHHRNGGGLWPEKQLIISQYKVRRDEEELAACSAALYCTLFPNSSGNFVVVQLQASGSWSLTHWVTAPPGFNFNFF
jgi:hypothetical protein